jgi:Proteasome stabiliser
MHAALRQQLGFDAGVWDVAQVGWRPGVRLCCASAAAWTPPSRQWTWRTQRWWDASPVCGTLASTRAAPIRTAGRTLGAARPLRCTNCSLRPVGCQTSGRQCLRRSLLQVKQLFALFLGNGSPGAGVTDATVAAAAPAVQVKLMGLFCRSLAAANAFPYTLQVRRAAPVGHTVRTSFLPNKL